MRDFAVVGRLLAERYQVEDVLGQGTFGRVYRALDTETGRHVALKEFVKQSGRSDSFLRELGISFDLRHPNIVDAQTLVMSGPFRYLVCEYMEAGSLRDLLQDGRATTTELVRLLLEVSEGVAFAHGHNVIHRDLKPENVLLTRRGGRLFAKVSDFGIATMGTSLGTRSSIGSPAYMAPEQFYDQYDARVDIYALGVVLYEILCGRRPFVGSAAQLMMGHIRREPEIPAWLPRSFARILKKALVKRPERRFACVETFAEAVRLALDAEGSALEDAGWPAELDDVLEVAHSSEEVLVRRATDLVRLDRWGRLLDIQPAVDRVVANAASHALFRSGTATVRTTSGTRAHRNLPAGVRLSLAADGSLAFCHDGGATVLDAAGAHAVAPAGRHVDAICFLGAEQTVCLAWREGDESVVSFGGTVLRTPGAVTELFGHPRRYELVARGAQGTDVRMLRPGHSSRAELACGDFSCDGDAFYAVMDDGDLACVNVASARVARTRWERRLRSVSAGSDRFIWATREGRVLCT